MHYRNIFIIKLQSCHCDITGVSPNIKFAELYNITRYVGITSGVNVWQHILHDWDDEKCIQILRNCMRALPDHGKVILSESVVSELEDNDEYTVFTASFDLTMLTQLEGGMEVAWSAPKANGQSSWVMLALLGFNSCSLVRRKGLTSGSLECYPTKNLSGASCRLMISD
jgi:hypothetical protein